jgi:cation transport regulator ChaC
MNRGIFEIRRGIHTVQARPAVLANYRICFNLPIGRGERGVANLELHDGARLWGVQYLITSEQAEHLDRMEGVPSGRYRRIPISVTLDGGEQIEAFTYQSDRISAGRKPSPRYMALKSRVRFSMACRLTISITYGSFELALDERLLESKRS